MEKVSFSPIGILHTSGVYKFEAPRQGVFDGGNGVVELFPGYGGDTLADLAGFERIWLIFLFHFNQGKGWKRKVLPPFSPQGRKIGLFATRAPYRPNPIGLSCVELAGVEQNRLLVRRVDLLDGTPILDIKPYIPEADAFPASAAGWRDEIAAETACWHLEFSEEFREKSGFLLSLGAPDMLQFCRIQLARSPLDSRRKRLYPLGENLWEAGCRTWRIRFFCDEEKRTVSVRDLFSHYQEKELLPDAEDPYGDKEIHRIFLNRFGRRKGLPEGEGGCNSGGCTVY